MAVTVITLEEFNAYAAEGYNRIPVAREVLSDLDTPLSVYLKLADGPYAYLFESVQGGENWGRHSIIGLPCRRVYSLRGHTLSVEELGEVVETRELRREWSRLRELGKAELELDAMESRWLDI